MGKKLMVGVCLSLLVLGCSQRTAAPVVQPAQQVQAPQADQAAQGSQSDVNIYVINAPGGNEPLPDRAAGGLGPAFVFESAPTSQPFGSIGEFSSKEEGSTGKDTRAGFMQAGLTFNIQTGGSSTGPQATGDVSGQTVSPNATVTQDPRFEPRATLSTPIQVGLPGSAPQQTSSMAAEYGTSGPQTVSQQNELRTLLANMRTSKDETIRELAGIFGQIFGIPVPAVPTSQPSE